MKNFIFFVLTLAPLLFGQRISDLPSSSTPGSSDLFPIVQSGITRKLTWANLSGSLSLTGSQIINGTITLGKLSPTILDYINASGGGTILNFPDEITLFKNVVDSTLSLRGTVQFGSHGAISSSASTNASSIQSMVTSIGTGTVIIASTGTIPINSVTIPSTIVLQLLPGSILSPASGQTLTINGGMIADPSQHFDTTGTVDLHGAKLTEIYPQWFGAKPTGSSVYNRKAIELSILQAPNKATVKFSDSMDVNGSISIHRSNIILDLNGATIRQVGTTCNSVFMTNDDVTTAGNLHDITIKNGRLIGSGLGSHSFGNHGCGVYIGTNCKNITVDNLDIQDMVHAGIFIGDGYLTTNLGDNIHITKNKVTNCGKDHNNGPGIQVFGDHVWILDNEVTGSAFNGIDCNAVRPTIQRNVCSYNGQETGSFDTLARCGIIIVADTIFDGDISYNRSYHNGNSTHNGDGIYVLANVGFNVNISHNKSAYNTRNGISAESAYPNGGQFILDHNSLTGNGTTGKNWNQIDIRVPYSIITENTLKGQVNHGIYVVREYNVLKGNTIEGTEYVSDYGIWLSALAFGSIVSENHITSFGSRAIMIESGADGSTITNNTMRKVYTDIIHDEASGTNRFGNSMMYGNWISGLTGQIQLVGGIVTITNHEVQTGDKFIFSNAGVHGTPGVLYPAGITDKTSFSIGSTSATDSSLVTFQIIH
jgi:Right handed beta helix region